MWFIFFTCACLTFSLMLLIVFKTKKHINNIDNKLFAKVNLATVVSTLIELILEITVKMNLNLSIMSLLAKLYLVAVTVWFTFFSIYVCYILQFKKSKYFNLVKTLHYIIIGISTLLYLAIPISIYNKSGVMYSFGPCVTLLKVFISIYVVTWIILSIINFKYIFKKSYVPILGVYILITANLIAQSIDPSLTLVSFTLTTVIYLMFFTIENPDLKMVNELYKNKNILEQTYVEKSNFLFEITQEVRNPLFDIRKTCEEAKKKKDIKIYQAALDKVEKYTKQLDFIVNDVLNVSTLDSASVKFIDNKYNFNLIFNQVIASVKDSINEKVKFNYHISSDIPPLYGDSIKIKQVITALLRNSIEHTKEGFIDISVNTIERFDAIRLIIEIKDTSKGMPIDVVNDILNTTASLDKTEIELLERNEINMNLCQKIVKLMGGNLLIKSTDKKGTEVILTIDQKLDDKNNYLGLFEEYVSNEKKVAIVTQNKKLNEFLRKTFNANDIKNTIILNGNYLIDDVKAGKHFDYIILESEMKEINGFTIFQKLNEIENFKTPVILLIEDESMKKHYLEEGFNDVILIDNVYNDIQDIINKY